MLVITATVTITFSKENDLQEAPPKNNGEQQKDSQRNRSTRDPGKQPLDKDVATPHGKELGGSQQATEGRAGDTFGPHAAAGSSTGIQPTRGLQTGASAEEEEWYQYACLIKEEPAPDDLSN